MTSQRYIIFGTAGHVDHGKSSLVLALTGTNPDRLAEEKAREMTIDLGFAFLSLPGIDTPVAIVDVPGHEMFVRNMVAGATGIDAAIFVVAADEGIMPQTVEHLEVLRQLQITTGVIALTKQDKAPPERIALSTSEVRDLVSGTFLHDAAIIPVSSVTHEGLPELKAELARIATAVKAKSASGVFRLPIDRVFTLKGAGTVITGTVISGSLQSGDTVMLLPQGRELRARSLQVHGEHVSRIFAGQRAAINLPDIQKEELQRGDVLATPGALAPSLMIDARLNLSAATSKSLQQRVRVRVHHETKEVMARVVLLEEDALLPAESTLAQLRLEDVLIPAAGDSFVIRSYSPAVVIGGGVVVDPHPPKRKKARGGEEVAEREAFSLDEIVVGMLEKAGKIGIELSELQVQCSLSADEMTALLEEMKAAGRVYEGRRKYWLSADAVEKMKAAIVTALAQAHSKEPLLAAVPLNVVLGKAAPQPSERECARLALEALSKANTVVVSGEKTRLASHTPQWTGKDAQIREKLMRTITASSLAVPNVQELSASLSIAEQECQRIITALLSVGELYQLAPDIYLPPDVITQSREKVKHFLQVHEKLTIPQARDLLNASRKYLLPLLEQFDREGVTVRQGDYRMLARRK